MIALSALLLVGAQGLATLSSILIDSCVDVDAEEVRRLASIELQSSPEVASDAIDVAVSCKGGSQELRLTHRRSARFTVRGIDLSASGAYDRDARARELALAIAELARRASEELLAERPAPVPAPTSAASVPELPPPVRPEARPTWRTQFGASAVVDAATGGEALFGVDLAARAHLRPWLIGDLRIGARKAKELALENGKVDGAGLAGSLGLFLDVTPYAQRAGVAFGARLGVAALRYSIVGDDGERAGVATAPAVSVSAGVTGFIAISRRFSVLVDAAVGSALHEVKIRENDRLISELGGALLSSSLGVAAQF